MSSIIQLPTELWQEIFEQYSQQCQPELAELRDRKGPCLLSRICHEWRDIVLSTPTLWSRIYFNSPWNYDSIPFQQAVEQRLELHLLRSQKSPLSIQLSLPISRHPSISRLYGLLIDHCDRWEAINFTGIEGDFHALFEQKRIGWSHERQSTPFPLLRSLHLGGGCCDQLHTDTFTHAAPNLRRIVISAPLDLFQGTRTIAFSQMTHITLRAARAFNVIEILLQCKNTIEQVSITESHLHKSMEWVVPMGSYIPLPQLHRLTLQLQTPYFGRRIPDLLQRITVPMLRHLNVVARSDQTIPILLDMFQRSNSPHMLNCLALRSLRCSYAVQLVSLIQVLINLEYLELLFEPDDQQGTPQRPGPALIISELHRHNISVIGESFMVVCPFLRHIGIELSLLIASNQNQMDIGLIADLLEFRRSRLEYFSLLNVVGKVEECVENRLKACKNRGQHITILRRVGRGKLQAV